LSSFPAPTRRNYEFDGWYTSPSGGSWVGTSWVFTGNTTIYAHWTSINNSINRNPDTSSAPVIGNTANGYAIIAKPSAGGTLSLSSTQAFEGTTIKVEAVPNAGYQFNYLSAEDRYGSRIASSATSLLNFTMPDHVVIVSAHFTKIPAPEPEKSVTPSPYPVQTSADFTDVSDSFWFSSAVDFVCTRGLFTGTSSTTFSPNVKMSRSMLATVLYRLAGTPDTNTQFSAFDDISSEQWYTGAVNWAVLNGIVQGGENGFLPAHNVTREQLATILYRYALYAKLDTSSWIDITIFSDYDQISPWARDAMAWAVSFGIIRGTGSNQINPQGEAARSEVAAMFMRFCNTFDK